MYEKNMLKNNIHIHTYIYIYTYIICVYINISRILKFTEYRPSFERWPYRHCSKCSTHLQQVLIGSLPQADLCVYMTIHNFCIYIYYVTIAITHTYMYIYIKVYRMNIFINYTQQFDRYLDPIFASGRFWKKYVVIEPTMNKHLSHLGWPE